MTSRPGRCRHERSSDDGTRLARWLADEVPGRAPEHLIHRSRDRIAATRQIGRLRALGLDLPRSAAVVAVLATAVVAAIVTAALLGAGSVSDVGPAPTPRPTLSSLEPYTCPSGGGTCLGPLPGGAYETTSFLPRVGLLLGDGWTNTLDTRGQVDLSYDAGGTPALTPAGITPKIIGDHVIDECVLVAHGCQLIPGGQSAPRALKVAPSAWAQEAEEPWPASAA